MQKTDWHSEAVHFWKKVIFGIQKKTLELSVHHIDWPTDLCEACIALYGSVVFKKIYFGVII
jgi:hypothetical protein